MRRVAEYATGGRFGRRRQVVRVDLHGVSVFGPGPGHTLIRWERIEQIAPGDGGAVVVAAATEQLRLPPGAFGLEPAALAAQLTRAGDRDERGVVIDELAGRGH